jgi:hypothetical protein
MEERRTHGEGGEKWNKKEYKIMKAGHVARMGETRNAYRILVGKAEGKRPLGRPRRRWVDNIRMDLKRDRMGWYGSGSG